MSDAEKARRNVHFLEDQARKVSSWRSLTSYPSNKTSRNFHSLSAADGVKTQAFSWITAFTSSRISSWGERFYFA